jgi:hypothetical protein
MTGGPLYRHIDFCRNAETLWHKLQSGHWDWLGRKPDGQFVLGSPRLSGRIIPSVSLKVNRRDVKEGQHGVRWLEWSGATDVEPNTDWLADEEKAKGRFEELVAHYENPGRQPCPCEGLANPERSCCRRTFHSADPAAQLPVVVRHVQSE